MSTMAIIIWIILFFRYVIIDRFVLFITLLVWARADKPPNVVIATIKTVFMYRFRLVLAT